MSFPRDLGRVSAQYESGGRGVEFVSSGSSWGDPGGDSYGVHQLSGAYSMGAFLRSKWGAPYKPKFGSLKPGTNSFNTKYRQVAKADPEGFEYAQKAYYATTHYVPLRDHAAARGFDIKDRGVQEALFSMSVQHGGAKKIVNAVVENGVPSKSADQIRALYAERSEYVMALRSLSTKIKNNIVNNRYKNELQDALELAGDRSESDTDIVVFPSPTLNKDVGDSITSITSGIFGLIASFIEIFRGIGARIGERLGEIPTEIPEVGSVPEKGEPLAWRETPWMATAKRLLGTREIKGKRSNSVIMGWVKKLGGAVAKIYKNDDIAWCGLFIAHLMNDNNIDINVKNVLGARNWGTFGIPTTPRYGAVMTFWRGKKSGWTGHVGTYVSEDDKYYHILGGNQSNSVNVTKIAKSRFLKARWPKEYKDIMDRFGPVHKKFDGKVSTNEA